MEYIDISHVLSEATPPYPGDCEITIKKAKSFETDHYTSYVISSGLHTGTHIDAPMHLTSDDRMVSDFPVACFSGRGVLLDVRGQTEIAMNAEYEKTVTEDSVVLLYTGFDKEYGSDRYFSNHPCVGAELGEFLLTKKTKILGMDMPSPDHPPYKFHKALLNSGIFVLENLTNLSSLLNLAEFEVLAFPLRIAAEASFVRAVCRVG